MGSRDLETMKKMLEEAEIEFEIHMDERYQLTYLETNSGVYFTFNEVGALIEVSNG